MGGALDGLHAALQRRAAEDGKAVEFKWLAESDPRRAAALLVAHKVQAVYTSVALAAECVQGRVDVVSFTPQCDLISRLQRRSTEQEARAKTQLQEAFAAMETIAARSAPRLILIEQSDGLRTHNSELYAWFNGALSNMPYDWAHGSIQAAETLGACHNRARLGWSGVRRVSTAGAPGRKAGVGTGSHLTIGRAAGSGQQ